jgi:putative ATPase
VPEGLAAALVDGGPASGSAKEALERYGSTLDDPEQPLIAEFSPPSKALLPSPAEAEDLFSCKTFDHILARELWDRRSLRKRGISGEETVFEEFAEAAFLLLADKGDISLLQSPPRQGERLSRILREDCGAEKDLAARFAAAEDSFFSPNDNNSDDFLAWDGETLEKCFKEAGFDTKITVLNQKEERLITGRDLAAWFDKEKSGWGAAIAAALGDKDFEAIRRLLEDRTGRGPLIWKWKSILLHGIKKS